MSVDFKFQLESKGKQEILSVTIPKYVEDYIGAQIRKYRFFPNVTRNVTCYICAVNRTRLTPEMITWVKRKICDNCNYTNPCILSHVSGVLSFESCQMAWWLANVELVEVLPNQAMLEGIIGHVFDKFLSDYFSRDENYNQFKESPSLYKIHVSITKLLRAEYDKMAEQILQNEKSEFGSTFSEHLLMAQKGEVFEGILNDYAFVYATRVYKNIKYGGEYRLIPARTWREKKVIGYDEFFDVRMFQVGRIDKLYQIDGNSFVIRDDKTTKIVREWGMTEYGVGAPSKQLGGYKHFLEQMYEVNVHVLGIINLLRYFDYVPVKCDETGYISILQRLCKFIRDECAPMKRTKGGICSEEWCPHFNNYCYKSALERL